MCIRARHEATRTLPVQDATKATFYTNSMYWLANPQRLVQGFAGNIRTCG